MRTVKSRSTVCALAHDDSKRAQGLKQVQECRLTIWINSGSLGEHNAAF